MKIRLFLLLLMAVCVSACGTTQRKKVTQGIDYSRYPYREAYYEFTSPVPQTETNFVPPSVETQPEISGEETLGEDEDFTSENLASSYHTYGDVVATVATRKFKLGEQASRKEMAALMKAVDGAYTQALRAYRPSGFTYSVSSVGAVNPLSDVEVYCRMSEQSANQVGQSACAQFFNSIRTQYMQQMQEQK